jgi:hypothetical protein
MPMSGQMSSSSMVAERIPLISSALHSTQQESCGRHTTSVRHQLAAGVCAGVACIALGGITLGVPGSQGKTGVPDEISAAVSREFAGDESGVRFSLSNDYTEREGHPGAGYPFIALGCVVEPSRETSFAMRAADSPAGARFEAEAISMAGKASPSSLACAWQVAQLTGAGDEGAYGSGNYSTGGLNGARVSVSFPSPGEYSVALRCSYELLTGAESAVTAAPTTTTLAHSWSQSVSCFYVRRELRDLSDDDRDRFLDAFVTLATTPTEKGRIEHGDHYKSLAEFELMHLNAAGDRSVDHIHDGLGIVTQHMAMTTEFELALQAVDSSLTVPYWDYTYDAYLVKLESGSQDRISDIFRDSELFTTKWFGATNEEQHTVTEGRFAYMEVPRSTNFSTHSAYGYLRAPWNLNPSRYVTRYHSVCGMNPQAVFNSDGNDMGRALSDYQWPTCASHYKMAVSEEFDTWYNWAWAIGYLPHGPVHVWLGGVGGGCDTFDELEPVLGSDSVKSLKTAIFGLLKDMWRSELVNTPEYCSLDAAHDPTACSFRCNKDDPSLMRSAINAASVYDVDLSALNVTTLVEVIDKLWCDTQYWPGDHLEAASPIEASFWPIHPTIERLLQYRELTRPFTDRSWNNATGADGEPGRFCVVDQSGCKGHHAGDLTFWYSVSLDASDGVYRRKHLTNEELRERMRPDQYTLPYIYNNFDWPHCSAQGYSFPSAYR